MKFLKKDKKELDLNIGLDAPPLPPNLGDKDLGRISLDDSDIDMPDIRNTKDLPFQKKIPPEMKLEGYMPSIKEDLQSDAELQSRFEGSPEPVFEAKKDNFEESKYKDGNVNADRYYERFEREAVREEKDLLKHKFAKKVIYIRIEKLKEILGDISIIKGNLKTANEMMTKMDDVSLDTNREFEKYRSNLIDLQKKLIFVDKSLFKGEKK